MSSRADHFAESERLVTRAFERIDEASEYATKQRQARDDAYLFLRAAQIHATLASCPIADVDRPRPGPPKEKP